MTWEELEGWWTDAGTFESLLRASKLVAETGANKIAFQGPKLVVMHSHNIMSRCASHKNNQDYCSPECRWTSKACRLVNFRIAGSRLRHVAGGGHRFLKVKKT